MHIAAETQQKYLTSDIRQVHRMNEIEINVNLHAIGQHNECAGIIE